MDTDTEQTKTEKMDGKTKEKQGILKSLRNNRTPYFHYLPETNVFRGGVINFRHIETVELEKYNDIFDDPLVQISSAFTKDIVARFSSYYARQGQPDFDLGE